MPLLLLLLVALLTPACTRPGPGPDTLVIALDVPPANLDPRIGSDASSERLFTLMFSSLARRDAQGNVEPDLAESWDTPDPMTYIFHLRNGVTFHDGRPLRARDVVYTFRSLTDGSIRSPRGGTYQSVQSVEAPDDRTVVFRLNTPFPSLLWNLTPEVFGIVPEGSGKDFSEHLIGTGPFEFVRYSPDAEVVLKRYGSYYGRKPEVETVVFKIIPEAVVRALELRKGSVDVALNDIPPDMVEVLKKDRDLNVTISPGTNYQYIAFNLRDPVFQDLRVRQAIAYAIDREKLIHYIWHDEVRPATGMIPPNNWAYEPDVKIYSYDPDKARQLLKEAGREGLTFTFRTSQDDDARLLAAVLQQQLKEVGIHMEIRSNEFATFYSDILNGNFQAYSFRWIGGNNDPDLLRTVFDSKMVPIDGSNRGHYNNPEVDRLTTMASTETDRDKRRTDYQKVQRILAKDLPYISLWYFDNVCVYDKRVQGVTPFPAGGFEFLNSVQLKPAHTATLN